MNFKTRREAYQAARRVRALIPAPRSWETWLGGHSAFTVWGGGGGWTASLKHRTGLFLEVKGTPSGLRLELGLSPWDVGDDPLCYRRFLRRNVLLPADLPSEEAGVLLRALLSEATAELNAMVSGRINDLRRYEEDAKKLAKACKRRS